MARIGTRAHAREILEWSFNMTRRMPSGWEKAGSGSFRSVYLHKATSVVYKIQDYDMRGYANKSELRAVKRLRSGTNDGWLTPHLRIPNATGYTFGDDLVLAMEYVEGKSMPVWNGSSEAEEGRTALLFIGRFDDMHGHNFKIQDDGTVVPIDLASPRRAKNRLDKADWRVLAGSSLRAPLAKKFGGW